jgi:hypothetical protein
MRISCMAFAHFPFPHVSLSFSSHVFISIHRCLVLSLGLLFADTVCHAAIARIAHETMRFFGRTLTIERLICYAK